MHALLADHALMAALLALSLRVIHSTLSMLTFVFPAVLALLHALSELFPRADRIKVRTLKAVLSGTAFLLPVLVLLILSFKRYGKRQKSLRKSYRNDNMKKNIYVKLDINI